MEFRLNPRSEYLYKSLQPFIDDLFYIGKSYEDLFDEFDSLDDYFVSIKIKEASIVNAFCGKHDKKLFKEIENGNIYKSEPLQELQLALNAAALKVYGLILQILLLQKMLVELKELWIEQRLHNDYAFYIKDVK